VLLKGRYIKEWTVGISNSAYIAGIERGESASEGKVHQGMDGWYFKQSSLTSVTGYAA
jgi:hypothetical protein